MSFKETESDEKKLDQIYARFFLLNKNDNRVREYLKSRKRLTDKEIDDIIKSSEKLHEELEQMSQIAAEQGKRLAVLEDQPSKNFFLRFLYKYLPVL